MLATNLAAILLIGVAFGVCSGIHHKSRTREISHITTVFNSDNITINLNGIYVAKRHAIYLITIINASEASLRLSRTDLAQALDNAELLIDGMRSPIYTFIEPAPTVNLPPVAVDDIYIESNTTAAVVTDSTFSVGKLDIDGLQRAIGTTLVVEGMRDILIEPKGKPARRVQMTVASAVPVWGHW